MQWVSI